MKFYNRDAERQQLLKWSQQAAEGQSGLTLIDIVALNELEKTALIVEVKRNPKNLRLSQLKHKAVKLERQLQGYEIEYRGLSLDDL